ncbi:MAG: TonB-dependent receptor [Candidatus Riflebacteria bacterium]|nr:TonB-dependent receptor [Candidatus Riflebacteria bacterium]
MNKKVFLTILMFLLPMAVHAVDTEKEAAALLYEPEQEVTSTRISKPAIESPSIISIMTQQQIQALGVRTIPELLEVIPGFNPWRSTAGDWWPGPRGVFDSNRSFVVMIDGVSVNNQFLGSPYWTYDLLDISRFSRIEIIRGPGSALYGSNAFLAVINCITPDNPKTGGTLKKIVGNFGEQGIALSQVWRTSRTTFDLDLAGFSSDGQSRWVPIDSYHLSGETHNRNTRRDFSLKVSDQSGLTLYLQHVQGDREGYLGYFGNVNDQTFFRRSNDLVSLKYNKEFSNKSEGVVNLFFNRFYDREITQAVSPGATFFNGVTYPLGATEEDISKDEIYGLNFQWNEAPDSLHRLSVRGEITSLRLVDSAAYGSYDFPSDPANRVFLPGVYPSPERFMNSSLCLQDDLRLDQETSLVFGLRTDNHSLFGRTWSPHLGLIRHLTRAWTGKLLFGQAFRNPDFYEITSNRNINREKIQTTELQFIGELRKNIMAKINFFINAMKDRIASSFDVTGFQNIGKTDYDGMEIELKKRFHEDQEVFANFSVFRLRGESSPPDLAPGVPNNRLNAGYSVKGRDWNFCLWGSLTSRLPVNWADSRPPEPGLALAHMTIQRKNFMGEKGRLLIRVRNLFNRYYEFASPGPSGLVADGLPQNGRELSAEYDLDF